MNAKNVIVAVAALAVGAALGADRARSPQCAEDGGSRHAAMPESKPRRKAPVEVPDEKPKENVGAETVDGSATPDDPFPRYLDMFKNDPEALAAEFAKEVEEDRASKRRMRDRAIARLKLNPEQAAVFEKALDGLRDEITRQNRESAELVVSGRLNNANADGNIWDSNRLFSQRKIASREEAVLKTAEMLYGRLVPVGVPDAEKQRVLYDVAYQTSFSCECYEPDLAVYDKVYKNMGFGKGLFSWFDRHRQKK